VEEDEGLSRAGRMDVLKRIALRREEGSNPSRSIQNFFTFFHADPLKVAFLLPEMPKSNSNYNVCCSLRIYFHHKETSLVNKSSFSRHLKGSGVGEHKSRHRLNNGDGTRNNARIMSALRRQRYIISLDI
jgi:hypothetical protein